MRIRVAALLLLLSTVVFAQDFRAMISGQVLDPSGAAIAGATVVATNVDTNVKLTTTTAADGHYVLAQVPTGAYTVTCDAAGFKKFSRSGVTLQVGDRSTINIPMQMGAQTESVTVTADVAAIDTDRSVVNQLMDNKAVSELPLNGRQVFMLMQLSAGTVFTQQQFGASGFSGTRAWDTNGSLTMHGGTTSSNQFNLDGASINAGTGEWKFAPLVDGIEEFKVSTPSSDASLGLSGGGVVNMTMKGGTNTLHGTLSEYVRNNIFDAVATQTNQSPIKATQHQWNDFSALVGGPIKKNKLFFSSWYEGFRERVPFPVTQTVPSDLERVGDFSNTRNASGAQIVIFDPFSTVAAGSGYARTAFPNNVIPASMQSPISKNLMAFFPHANAPGNPFTAVNNYIATPNIGKYGYNAWYSKFDYVWNQNQRTTASVSQDWGFEYRSGNGIQNSPAKSGNDPLRRINYGSTLDHVWTVNSTTVVDIRAAWQRYINYSAQEAADTFDGSQARLEEPDRILPDDSLSAARILGLSHHGDRRLYGQPHLLAGPVVHAERIGVEDAEQAPAEVRNGDRRNAAQSLHLGLDVRQFLVRRRLHAPQSADVGHHVGQQHRVVPARRGGERQYRHAMRRAAPCSAPTASSFRTISKSPRNSLSIWACAGTGRRPITERYDRMIVGWDPAAKYALGSGSATGGLVFAKPGARTSWDASYTGFQPRIGLAYQLPHRIVMRGSYGMSYLPLGGTSGLVTVRQNGYSRSTPYNATVGGGLATRTFRTCRAPRRGRTRSRTASCSLTETRSASAPPWARASPTTRRITRRRTCTSSTSVSSTNCRGGTRCSRPLTSAAVRAI